jgi:DDE family transposase
VKGKALAQSLARIMRDGEEMKDGCGKKRAVHMANRCSNGLRRVSASATAAMSNDTLLPLDLPSVGRKKLTIDFAGGNQSSDGGLLLLRAAERKLGVCRRLAEAMPDRRDPERIRHAMFEMVMARASAIACGYEDAIDLNRLRHDPLMKVAVGRCPESGAPLAQSTISRPENAPSKTEAARLFAPLLDQFGTTVKRGKLDVLDIDDTFSARRMAANSLHSERPSRRAWFRVDAHLSRGERHASGGVPAHHKSHKRHRRPMTSYGVGIAPRRMRDKPARRTHRGTR